MRKWLKISVLGLALLALTACGSAQKKDELVTGVVPTKQVEETSNKEEDDQNQGEDMTTEAEGDYAKNVIIALDPGHGGGFVGASYSGRNEKDLTLKMATYVKEYLEANYTGMEIYLTREEDSALSGDVKVDLEMRAQYAQDVNADVLVSLHFNASEDHSQKGSMVLVSHRENVSEASKELGNSILEEFETLGLVNNGTVTRNSNDMFDDAGNPLDYYAINRHCAARDIPGIIVEHCFMDNTTDQVYIDSEEDLRALAKADAVGIATFFGLAKK